MNNGRLRITNKGKAMILAGIIAFTPVSALAITDNSYKPGTFVKEIEQDVNTDHGIYIVIEGDNWSHISEKVCSHLRIDITQKYWPTLYKYNDSPKVIRQGMEIKYPKTSAELLALYSDDVIEGNVSKVKQATKPYPKLEKISYDGLGQLIYEHYGDSLGCIDPDLIQTYLKVTRLNIKYELRDFDKPLEGEARSDFMEYWPTIEEYNKYVETHKVKTKK